MSKKLLEYAGIAASVVLITFGIGAVVTGLIGRSTVRTNLAQEQIVGTPDSTIPGQTVNTGSEARAFAQVMRKHVLAITGGKTYAEMPRFMGKNGQATNDEKLAAVDPKSGKPLDNAARNIWVSETALSTALNTAYFAEQVALFSVVMGFALLLTGIGFLVLTLRVLNPALAAERKRLAARAVPVAG
jgi:hypothetical protein